MKFRLTISGKTGEYESDHFADCFLTRDFEFPVLPRIRETIELAGDMYTVDEVRHCLKEGIAEVLLINLELWQLCDAFLDYEESWKISGNFDEKEFDKALYERKVHRSR